MMFSLLYRILMCAAFCILSSTSSNAGILIILLFYIQMHCRFQTKQRWTLSLRAFIFPSGVSLTCNKTVEVEAGKSLKLNCTIKFPLDCRGEDYIWEDPNNNIICNSTSYRPVNYTCEWDGETYVSLLIRNVTKSQNYTVQIWTDCGYPDTSTVEVKLQVQSDRE